MRKSNRSIKAVQWLAQNSGMCALAIVILIGTIINPRNFMSMGNMMNVLRQSTMVGLLACGMTIVIIVGEIDLTISALYCLTGIVAMKLASFSVILALLLPIVMCGCVGIVNSIVINTMKVPPYVATLALGYTIRGIGLLITDGRPVTTSVELPDYFYGIARGTVFGIIPVPAILMIACYALIAYILGYTTLGRNIYATGGNLQAAKMMGINTERTKILAHMMTCMLAAVSGLVLLSRVGSAQPDVGTGYEMYAVASTAIGGTHLGGGRGKVTGTLLGALVITFLTNIINMQSYLDITWEKVLIGLVLIVAIMTQNVTSKLEKA